MSYKKSRTRSQAKRGRGLPFDAALRRTGGGGYRGICVSVHSGRHRDGNAGLRGMRLLPRAAGRIRAGREPHATRVHADNTQPQMRPAVIGASAIRCMLGVIGMERVVFVACGSCRVRLEESARGGSPTLQGSMRTTLNRRCARRLWGHLRFGAFWASSGCKGLSSWHAAPAACGWKNPRGAGAPRTKGPCGQHPTADAPGGYVSAAAGLKSGAGWGIIRDSDCQRPA